MAFRRCQNRGNHRVPGAVSATSCLRTTRHPAFRRRECGSGSDTEPWNLSSRWQGNGTSGTFARLSTDARHRGGTTRSSVEGPVMGRERRGRVIPFSGNGSIPSHRERNPWLRAPPSNDGDDRSRMSREAHVRFWEGVGVKFPCATQQSRLRRVHCQQILTPREE